MIYLAKLHISQSIKLFIKNAKYHIYNQSKAELITFKAVKNSKIVFYIRCCYKVIAVDVIKD